MKRILALINMAIFILGVYCQETFSQTAEEYYRKAIHFYYVEQDRGKAAAELKEALRINPSYKEALEFLRLIGEKIEVEAPPGPDIVLKEEIPSLVPEVGEELPKETLEQVQQLTETTSVKKIEGEIEKEIAHGQPSVIEDEVKQQFPEKKVEYYIEPEDVLEILVWRVDELKREVTVLPDGMISFPLIGEIKAAGLPLKVLNQQLTTKLSEYIRNPQVFISVKKFGGKKVLVLGEVKSQGIHRYTGEIKVSEAVALAGGFTEEAKIRNVLVIRGDLQKAPQGLVVNFKEIFQQAKVNQDIIIQSMDIVYVPRTFIANVNLFLRQYRPGLDILYTGAIVGRLH